MSHLLMLPAMGRSEGCQDGLQDHCSWGLQPHGGHKAETPASPKLGQGTEQGVWLHPSLGHAPLPPGCEVQWVLGSSSQDFLRTEGRALVKVGGCSSSQGLPGSYLN